MMLSLLHGCIPCDIELALIQAGGVLVLIVSFAVATIRQWFSKKTPHE